MARPTQVEPFGGDNFRTLVGNYAQGFEVGQVPAALRQTVEIADIRRGRFRTRGRMTHPVGLPAPAPQTATVTIADATLMHGAQLRVGDYVLTPWTDFAVDAASVANTATNLAASLNRLPKVSATANVADVDIEITASERWVLSARQGVGGAAFTIGGADPRTGEAFTTMGTPSIGGPDIT